jgi:fumarate hydratase class II
MGKNNKSKKYRITSDSMGEMQVPSSALYGAQTQRAVNNFPISGIKFNYDFINAVIIIKRSAAIVNLKLKLINKIKSNAIVKACDKLLAEKPEDQFPVDIFQTGSGTSTNMNVNEVLATIANTFIRDQKNLIHPNDHINMGQSSNDVIPTAIHISSLIAVEKKLVPSLVKLELAISVKVKEFDGILKIGRTHLQDATPMTLGQEFSGYQSIVKNSLNQINQSKKFLSSLAQGGTAVGTGINTHKKFGLLIADEISTYTKIKFLKTKNHFEAQSSQNQAVAFSGSLKTLAIGLNKIANDIRWLGSGPRSGIGELTIPPVQPGSSIMPGKVNPVICESMIQVCSQVIANDTAISLGGLGSVFELNLMLPLIAHNMLFSINILSNSINVFVDKLLINIQANSDKCESYIEGSLAMCTSLVPEVGYDKAAQIAYEAFKKNKTIRQVLKDNKILSDEKIEKLLDLKLMIKPK